MATKDLTPLTSGPGSGRLDWYKDAVIYQLHVKTFCDSNGDGIGDFPGLISKLDYLQDLGVTAIWLLPFYPSPLRDDGYDIAAYKSIHPDYGTINDFRRFMREAKARGLAVITELVINHTSDQHPWFQRARRAPAGSRLRDFYVWSDTPDKWRDARIIFIDTEHSNWTYDPVAGAYYWHRFYSHQPDLNFNSPAVKKAVLDVLDFWLAFGVDGLRLDAIPYLHEAEGTNCENLPETHDELKAIRAHMDGKWPGRMLLAEANQWPEDAVTYFGQGIGDECHMNFHFPLMPRMYMAVKQEDRFPIIDILEQTPEVPESCQWAIFLRNHDELTLEMVTDEERDYMYRQYAEDSRARINLGIRRRLAPLMQNDRRTIELMNALLFSLPGTPVVYYGDEIGMGDNIYLGDRNGVRTPMQWTADRNAGFSMAPSQRLFLPVIADSEYHYAALNVEAQQASPSSLLSRIKRLIELRKRFEAFGRGEIEFILCENRKVLCYLRRYGDELILVVANLSRHAQFAELDLRRFEGMVPEELIGRTEFPEIGELPYLLTLGPRDFYWFSLTSPEAQRPGWRGSHDDEGLPEIAVRGAWTGAFHGNGRAALEAALPAYMADRRWFSGKDKKLRSVTVTDSVELARADLSVSAGKREEPVGAIVVLRADYVDADAETYVLPLTAGERHLAGEATWIPQGTVARLRTGDTERFLYDATGDPAFSSALLAFMARRRTTDTAHGTLTGATFSRLTLGADPVTDDDLPTSTFGGEQSNSSTIYGTRFVAKLFRRLEPGENPDVELGSYLTGSARFPHTPRVLGTIDYARGRGRRREVSTLAVLQDYVPNEGDAWALTLDAARFGLEEGIARRPAVPAPPGHVVEAAAAVDTSGAQEVLGYFYEHVRLLGQRTGELHVALAGATDPALAPEELSALNRRALYQSMRTRTRSTFAALRRSSAPAAALLADSEADALGVFELLRAHPVSAHRMRVHSDYHLGQLLWTGKDFVVVDFEGEPARPIGERRLKRLAMADVAGMLRSFHYAAYTAYFDHVGGGDHFDDGSPAERATAIWYGHASATFLAAYLEACGPNRVFLPDSPEELGRLIDVFLLEKALYEITYELANRPDWLAIPVLGVRALLS